MLKKLDHPIVWGTLFGCFFAPFGFAASGASDRVVYAASVNAVHQRENVFEWEWGYAGPGVKPFAFLLILVGAAAVALFFWQLHLTRQCMRDLERATNAARKAANEKTAALAQLTDHHLEPELFI
jgi:hypothetical protein